ncbi:YfiR/HmsC family protein [Ekhidna sp.]
MKTQKEILFLFITFLISHLAVAQTERQKQMVESTYSVIKNIEWPKKESPFKIHVITTDEDFKQHFRSTSKNQKLAGRDVAVSFTGYVIAPQGVDVIFVANQYNATIPTLLDRVSGKEILLITDQYDKQLDVMVNFLSSKSGELTLEYNRANISYQGLQVKSGIQDLKGSEIDLAKIFKQARDSIRSMELRTQQAQARFDSMSFDVAAAIGIYRQQQSLIQERDMEIALRQNQIKKQGEVLDSLSAEFAESEKRLIDLTQTLESREAELLTLGTEIAEQRDNVAEGNKILDEQKKRIADQNDEIAQRESRLEEMSTVVDSQQSALVFLVLFLVAVVGFSFLIFTAYRARKKAAKKLAEQKEDLGRLVEELKETQSQLVQSEKMASLGVLTAGIAHEINNAINFVYSGIHVLSDKFSEIRPVISQVTELKEEEADLKKSIKDLVKQREEVGYDEAQLVIDQMINSIQVGAERTTEIVKGLRIFSRSETEKKTKIDIHNDIDVALLLLNSRHKDVIKIEKNFADEVLEVDGFKGQLSQAFLNIISNSIDSLNENGGKGNINIVTDTNGKEIEVKIVDNGVGMSKEEILKIFDPFYTTKKVGAGTGLGLSITYGIIERHGGTISVNSKPTEGAEFIIKLPLAS